MIQNQESIHYRAASKATHSGVEVLHGHREIPRIIIDRIEYVENIVINGRTERCAFVAHFRPGNGFAELPMILNQTNCRRITKLYPECEGYLARLKNIAVRLTSESCKDPNGGGQTLGRYPAATEEEMQQWLIENGYAPAQAPAPARKVITVDKVAVIVEWALKNGLDMAAIKERYDFESQTVEDAVMDGISAKPQDSDDLPE
jgi:hypothetical protein